MGVVNNMLSDVKRISEILIERRFRLADCEFGCSIVLAELVKKMILVGYVPNRLDVSFGKCKIGPMSYSKVTKEDMEKLLEGTGIELENFRNEYSYDTHDYELTLWLKHD